MMNPLKISSSKDYLIHEDNPFFYLADTIWMAFSNLSMEHWPEYLSYRRSQGFNALQISILPITHDDSESSTNLSPFQLNDEGKWDFFRYNDAYFEKAERMLEMAVEHNFIPVLGVLWCNYVPETWAAKRSPFPSAMPFEAVEPYVQLVAKRFKKFNPIYFISGDTRFDSQQEVSYYLKAVEVVKEKSPESLTTLHLAPDGEWPDDFIHSPLFDFYMYQSGHGAHNQHLSYDLGKKFYNYPVKRPVVNSEPCYEGHQTMREKYGRFSQFDVRKASWLSLLSGAKMGVSYGAHGVWTFHRPDMNFLNQRLCNSPFTWQNALRLPGAWDVSFAKWIFETYDLFDIAPLHKIVNETDEIVMSADKALNKIVIYYPYTIDLAIDLNLTDYKCILLDLEKRNIVVPSLESGPQSLVRMHEFNADALLVAVKKE